MCSPYTQGINSWSVRIRRLSPKAMRRQKSCDSPLPLVNPYQGRTTPSSSQTIGKWLGLFIVFLLAPCVLYQTAWDGPDFLPRRLFMMLVEAASAGMSVPEDLPRASYESKDKPSLPKAKRKVPEAPRKVPERKVPERKMPEAPRKIPEAPRKVPEALPQKRHQDDSYRDERLIPMPPLPQAQKWDGNSFPLVGIGVGNLDHDKIPQVAAHALHSNSGYRLIDTAAASHNERMLADVIQRGGGSDGTSPVHIVTKVWYTHLGYERTKLAVKASLSNLLSSTSASDVRVHVLIHWPRCDDEISWMDCEGDENRLPQDVKDAGPPPHLDKENAWKGSWKALEDIYSPKGGEKPSVKIESIGVSNFDHNDLGALLDECRIKPHLFQGNVWALMYDPFLMKLVRDNGIIFQAYNVMNGIVERGDLAPNAYRRLEDIGRNLSIQATTVNTDGRNFQPFHVSKVVLAWLVQQGISVIPRASSLSHQDDNSPRSLTEVPTLTQLQKEDIEKAVSSLLKGQDLEGPSNEAPEQEEQQQQEQQQQEQQQQEQQQQEQQQDEQKAEDQTVPATFLNSLPQGDISIFWRSDTGEEVPAHNAPVKVGESASLSTHPGHVFVVYNEAKTIRREFQVDADYGGNQNFAVTEF